MRLIILALALSGCVTGGQVQRAREEHIGCLQRYNDELATAVAFSDSFHLALGIEGDCWGQYERQNDVEDPAAPSTARRCIEWRRSNEKLEATLRQADQRASGTSRLCEAKGKNAQELATRNERQAEAWSHIGDSYSAAAAVQATAVRQSRSISCVTNTVGGTSFTNCN